MIKFLKWALAIILIVVLLLYFVAIPYIKAETKKNSPQQTITFNENVNGAVIELSVDYSKPYKKGRVIFGGLVPYGKVWRTGANENTVFKTNKDLTIGGKKLPAGEYSLWTIPERDKWTVIWNNKQYLWGIKRGKVASREPEYDALQIKVGVDMQSESLEQFNIAFERDGDNINIILAWDKTRVIVPMSP